MQKGELKLRVAVEGGAEAAQQIRQVEQANAGAVKATGRAAEAASQSVQDVARAASAAQQRAARDTQDSVNRSAQAVGVSSRQAAAALRMLPAQFSDIAVSLQGGQNPLTVLLQQGAQIKDSFGGVGAAARALGGYTLGLINPVSAIGTAMGVVAVAAYAGSRETTALAQSVIATGHAAGKTAGQLQMMAANAAQGAGMSRSAVSGALTELVSSGRVGEQVLSDASTAAAAWSKATGVAVSDIAKDFAALAADPLSAALKLNESMNHLTVSTYEQIRALQEQGRYTDAADLAQRTYADTLAQRAPQMVEQLGLLERGWKAIKSAVGGAVDALKGLGRGNLEEARLEQVRANIQGVRRAMADPQLSPQAAIMRQNLQNLQAEETRLQAIVEQRQKAAQAAGEQTRQVQATARWDEISKGHMTEEARLRAELLRIEQVGLAAGKSRAEIVQLQADASAKVNARQVQEQKRSAQLADQVAQQSATHELAMRRLVDADALASVRDRVQRSVLSQEQGIAEVARIEREAALRRAADLEALARGTKDPIKRDKATQDAALARREAFSIEQQALRETTALREKHQQAYQESLNAVVGQEMKRAESLADTARALGLQTAQARENGLVIDSVATILAREEASRYAVAAASTQQALAAALARQAGEQEVAALSKQLELLQRLAEQKSGVTSASAATDLRQAALDQTKRLFGQSNPFETWGQTLRDTFGQGGDGLARMVSSMGQLTTAAQDYAREMSVIKALRDSRDDENRKTADENELKLIKKTEAAQISAYASMASSAKGYFGKQTAAYKVLHATEVALRTYQMASSVAANSKEIAAIAQKVVAWVTGETTMTATSIVGSQTRVAASVVEGQAVAAVGVANQAKGDPYSAWVRMAAMAAAMATLGFAVSGGARARAAAPTNEGKGTVFGDANATSESFEKSLDLLNRTQDEMLIYTREMTNSLRSIDAALGGATNVYLRGGGVSGLTGTIATGKMDTGLSSLMGKAFSGLPVVGGLLKGISSALFGKTVSITGSGISAGAQSLGNIVNNGFQGNYYADVTTTKKFFGFKSRARTHTQYSDMDPTLEGQFTSVFQGIYSSIGSAAMALEQDMGVIGARLNAAVVDIGRVDLQGLDGRAIAERLSAVFGAQADRLAGSVIPGFEALQKVGEGYYETLIRVANQYEMVNLYTARLGDTLGATGISGARAADALIKAFGGMDGYVGAIKQFYEDFYSETERGARMSVEIGEVFSRLGLSVPATMNAYRDLVNAQDLTTESGRSTYSALLALGPAFANVANQALEAKRKIEDERAGLQDQLDRLTGNTAAIRSRELAALDESNRALQKRIWALEDEKEAAEFAASAGGRIVDFVKRLDSGSLGLGSAIERVGSVRVQYEAQLAAARRGDKTALEGITNSASDYLQAARDSAANQLEYSIKLAQVKSDLSLVPAARTHLEQLGESQLKVMGKMRDGTDQVRALLAELKEISIVQATTLAANTHKGAQRQEDLLRFWERLEQDGVFDGMGSDA